MIVRRILLIALLLSPVAAIDPEQFACEEAVAHLHDCCGDRLPQVDCGQGCSDVTLSLDNATCIRKASCQSLKNAGACDDPTALECQ